MADLGLLAGVLLASGTGLVGAAVYGLRSHRKAVKEPLGSVACGMPSPDYSLFCVGEIGHDRWCHHEGTEWHDDVWAVDHWADTQQAPLCGQLPLPDLPLQRTRLHQHGAGQKEGNLTNEIN